MTPRAPSVAPARPVSSLRTLLRGVVDYAGLFPPAARSMEDALAEYAGHRDGPHAWALGRFVLPAARLEELEETGGALMPREGGRSWALSALLSGDVEDDVARIEQFNARHRDARLGAVQVDTVELRTYSPRDIARAAGLLDRRYDTYMEIPVSEDPAELLAAVAQTSAKAKLRMGGVTADAFPSTAQVARFIARSVGHGVSFKATAGLHHPIRSEYRLTYAPDAPTGTMFGFLNLLLATAAIRAGLDEQATAAILEERSATALRFDDEGSEWRGTRLSTDALQQGRESLVAFGSCSFREPLDDLHALGLL